jgi:hypothetical protein
LNKGILFLKDDKTTGIASLHFCEHYLLVLCWGVAQETTSLQFEPHTKCCLLISMSRSDKNQGIDALMSVESIIIVSDQNSSHQLHKKKTLDKSI